MYVQFDIFEEIFLKLNKDKRSIDKPNLKNEKKAKN